MSASFGYYANLLDKHKIEITTAIVAGASMLLLLRRWFAGGQFSSSARLDGKLALITGANCGIGLETAKELARRGATVVLACRNQGLGKEAEAVVGGCCGEASRSRFMQLDLSSLRSIRDFCDRFQQENQQLDLLVNNAGVMACPESKTEDGFELQLGVNHLGHFLLTKRLMPLLKSTPQARVVTVSSIAHTWGTMNWENLNLHGEYTPFKAYSQSKLANILFTKALANKLKDDDVTAYSVHPGAVQTNLGRHLPTIITKLIAPIAFIAVKRPVEGAQTSLHCLLAPLAELVDGGYYSDCRHKKTSKLAESMEDAKRLWEISDGLVGE